MLAPKIAYLVGSGYQPVAPTVEREATWSEGEGNLFLPHKECHVWTVRLDQTPQCVSHLWGLLSASEKIRAQQYYVQLDMQRFVVARGLLRVLLGHYTGLNPANIEFHYTKAGKPGLDGSDLQFSKSASGGLGLFAFNRGGEIGVDIEMRIGLDDLERLIGEFFSMDEQAQIEAAPNDQRIDLFFRGWTRKEALLKALGTGFVLDPRHVKVSLADTFGFGNSFDATVGSEPINWVLKSWEPMPSYQAALALRTESSTASLYRLVSE